MIVVIGAGGQLGTAFAKLLPEARLLYHRELDLVGLTAAAARETLTGASTVINCAAYTAVDRAETELDTAMAINATAVGTLAQVTADLGVPLVTYSTDYVFDGDGVQPYLESDLTDPINAYGRTKRVGEQEALAAHPGCLVIRTSWVISGTHPNFVATIVRKARESELSVVDDQRGSPTVVDDLAQATLSALAVGATGLLHLTNTGETTWFALAREAVRLAGMDPARVSACSTEEYPTPARRPAYSVLGSERRAAMGIDPLPPWEVSLPALVKALVSAG